VFSATERLGKWWAVEIPRVAGWNCVAGRFPGSPGRCRGLHWLPSTTGIGRTTVGPGGDFLRSGTRAVFPRCNLTLGGPSGLTTRLPVVVRPLWRDAGAVPLLNATNFQTTDGRYPDIQLLPPLLNRRGDVLTRQPCVCRRYPSPTPFRCCSGY